MCLALKRLTCSSCLSSTAWELSHAGAVQCTDDDRDAQAMAFDSKKYPVVQKCLKKRHQVSE